MQAELQNLPPIVTITPTNEQRHNPILQANKKSQKQFIGDDHAQTQLIQHNKNNLGFNKIRVNRSGSVPSQKYAKQLDIYSVSTMTGTLSSHKSDKRIDDLQLKSQQNACMVKFPAMTKSIVPACHSAPLMPTTVAMNSWSITPSGDLVSNTSDITTIKYYFMKVATKLGMIVMRDLQDIVTVKLQKMDSIKCLFTMCLPMSVLSDRNVYQLERYKVQPEKNKNKKMEQPMQIKEKSKIKLVLISGNQTKFEQFKRMFFYQLWSNNVLNLSNFQILSLLSFINKCQYTPVIVSYEKACNQFDISNLADQQEFQIYQNQLMRKFKQAQQKLKQIVLPVNLNTHAGVGCSHQKLIRTPINQIILQRILINQIPVCEFYFKIEMDKNKEFHAKRKRILSKYSARQVFQFLQIDMKLMRRNTQNNSQKFQNKYTFTQQKLSQVQFQKLPYYQAARNLNEMYISQSPFQNIRKISIFSEKLKQIFQQYLGKSDSMLDMDNQLPLTIYCTLLNTNAQLKPIISFLCDYFESEDDFQNQNRTLAALKAALEYVRVEWKQEEPVKKQNIQIIQS